MVSGMEVHNRMHTEGAGGTGNSFRACTNVQGSNFTTKDVRVAGTYGLGILQGSFNVNIDGVLGFGDRHTVDMDTCDYCKVTDAVSRLGTSAPFGIAHNGVGGSNNTIEGTVYVEGQNYVFNARGFHEVTGQGASEVTFPMLAPTVKIKAVQARDKGTTLNTGVYFRMPIVDANVEVDLRNGDGTLDTLNSTAVRLYPYRCSGKVKVRSRGYTRAVFGDVHDIGTTRGHVLELDIDCDNGKQALYSRGGDGYKLSINAGPGMVPDYDAALRPDETLLRFEEPSDPKRLRYLEITKLVTSLVDAEKGLIGVTNTQGNAVGSIGVIDTNAANTIYTEGADFTLTRGRILAAGSKAIRIDGSAACKITEIEKGLFFGQEVQLWSTTEGTFPVTIEAFTTTNYLGDVTRTLGYAPISLRWDGSRWRPLGV
ncbi:hypothetical protein GCM10007927_12490 [Sulfitobacter pacificus]|uniref:Uncharacterized protein n=3 Tax=Sulfitobacter pacificus TaxID=1499314 RepID=A0ABQ5VHA8_9RHOB|nr:hypothetical protein GCM10007927_12490 [Sulfitobacter pacificus]